MKILIATDGTECSQMAIRKYCELARGTDLLEIMIIGVTEEVMPLDAFPQSAEYSRAMEEAACREAEKHVSDAESIVRENLKHRVLDITPKVVTGAPAEVITRLARDCDADLIVVGSHGRGSWGRALIGSVSDAVIHHADCSVLVVKP